MNRESSCALHLLHQPFATETLADTGFIEKIDRDLLDHARTYAAHMFAGVSFENEGIDSVLVSNCPSNSPDEHAPMMATECVWKPHCPAEPEISTVLRGLYLAARFLSA